MFAKMDTFHSLDFKLSLLFVILCECCVCFGQDTFYFNLKPTDQAVIEGTELTLLCDVSNRRHIQFHWIHNSKPITNSSRRFQDGSNLRILRVTRNEDSGPFQCIATNVTTGFSLQSGEATLDIQWIDPVATVELKKGKDEKVELGSDIQLKCQVDGNPEPIYTWYHNKYKFMPAFNKDHVKIVDKGTRLKINNITASDNGVYACRAENLAGTVDSTQDYLLNIKAPNTPHLIEDKFTPYKLVVRGDSARLDCPFVNATKIEWFASYEKLTNSTRYTIFNNGSLYFPKVRKPDEAVYRCEGLTTNPDVAQMFSAHIYLAYLDDFNVASFEPRLIPSYPMVVPVHEPFTVRTFVPEGRPTPSYRWLNKNDMTVLDTGAIRVMDSNLFFEDPEQTDSGNYTFIVNNTAGEKRQSVWIIVSVPPTIRRNPQAREVSEGDDVEFTCQVVGTAYPVTTIIWQKNDEFIKLGSPRHYMNRETGTLRISMVTEEDRGEYFCIANTTGQKLVRSLPARLRVKRKLKFNPIPKNVFLELDSDAEVHCRAEAEVNPRVNWIKGNANTGANVDFSPHIIDADGTLYFRRVQRNDAGPYTCVAYVSTRGSPEIINKTIFIYVVEKPKFQIQPTNKTAYEDHSMMLHCVATGDPRPHIEWDKNGIKNIWDTSRFTFYPNGSMLISRVYREDQGLYGCTANNSAGMVHTTAFLYVASKKYVKTLKMFENSAAVAMIWSSTTFLKPFMLIILGYITQIYMTLSYS